MKLHMFCGLWMTALLSWQVLYTGAVNPGFRTILTAKGLKYAHQVGYSVLIDWLCNHTIPPIEESHNPKRAETVTLNYTLSNLTINSLDFGNSSLTSDIRGVVLTDNDISASLFSDWSYMEDEWPHLTDYGSVDASIHGLSVSVTVDVLANKTDGHFMINATECSLSVDKLDIVFHGSSSFLYNLFGPAIEDSATRELNTKACAQIIKWLNTTGNTYVHSIPVVLKVNDESGVLIDYALVSNVNFTDEGHIVADHKGEFLLHTKSYDPPFDPPPLPDPSADFNDSKMVYIIATNYVAETALYAFWKAGFLTYNYTLPICNGKTLFKVAATDYPRLNISNNSAIMRGEGNASTYTENDGHWELDCTFNMSVQADVKPYLNEINGQYYISGKVSNLKINTNVVDSVNENYDCQALKDLIMDLAPTVGLDYINKYTQAGFPIPTRDGVSFTNPTLELREDYIVVGSDIRYEEKTGSCDFIISDSYY